MARKNSRTSKRRCSGITRRAAGRQVSRKVSKPTEPVDTESNLDALDSAFSIGQDAADVVCSILEFLW